MGDEDVLRYRNWKLINERGGVQRFRFSLGSVLDEVFVQVPGFGASVLAVQGGDEKDGQSR